MSAVIPDFIQTAREKFGTTNTVLLEAAMEAVAPHLAGLMQRVAALEKQLAEVETQQKEWTYTGAWRDDRIYKRGNFCTVGGSMWHCERDHIGCRPGDGDAWRLSVKRGADARGAR